MTIRFARLFTLMFLGLALVSCEKDSDLNPDEQKKQGTLELEITDAPVDDPAIKSVFVTIADVQVEGQSMPGFNPVEVDLLTLQDGTVELLSASSIKVGAYGQMTLVLDPEKCYVEEFNETRHALLPEEAKLEMMHDFIVEEDSTVRLLVDFDLRKSIRRNMQDSTDKYDFVASSELVQALRVLDKDKAGQLSGKCNDASTGSEMIVAFLYKKGEFDATIETEDSAESQLRFKNAVTSALVKENGTYLFPFITAGNYEMHFASYDVQDSTKQVQFRGLLEVGNSGMADVLDISIESAGKTELDLSITGLLPL